MNLNFVTAALYSLRVKFNVERLVLMTRDGNLPGVKALLDKMNATMTEDVLLALYARMLKCETSSRLYKDASHLSVVISEKLGKI